MIQPFDPRDFRGALGSFVTGVTIVTTNCDEDGDVGVTANSNTEDFEGKIGLPIYFTPRTALSFISGCGMVPVVLLIDYAHDEGAEFLGFGTDGRFFGRFLESPIPFLLFWIRVLFL